MPIHAKGLDPFYLIVATAADVARFAAFGVRTIQLRAKGLSPRDAQAEISTAIAATRLYPDCQLIVNDYWREGLTAGCTYVHLGQEDMDDADIPALKAAGIRIGLSTHDDAELARALAAAPDYVALGPIHATQTKSTGRAPQGLQTIAAWRKAIGPRMPLVAIGGIALEHAEGIVAAGADSCAVVSDVLASTDPALRARHWLDWAAGVRTA